MVARTWLSQILGLEGARMVYEDRNNEKYLFIAYWYEQVVPKPSLAATFATERG